MKLLLPAILFLSLIACNESFEPNFERYNLHLQVIIPEHNIPEIDSVPSIEVYFYNKNKDYAFTSTSDKNGYVKVDNIEFGIYTLSIAEEIIGKTNNYFLNGNKELIITESHSDTISTTIAISNNNFLIREYYYGGSTTPEGKIYFYDQFVEIYNNGQDTLMADSLLLIELESYGQSPNYWSGIQSDSIVVKTIWAVPGSGNTYPIPPGKGFIIACDAMNHQSDPNGNPHSPVNLFGADFEFWSDKKADGDIDFPAKNMIQKLWVQKGNDFIFHTRGGSAIAIVKIPMNVDNYISNNYITQGSPTSTSKYFCKIPNAWVIDAVEATWNDKLYKRFDTALDAGSTTLESGSYKGYSVRRSILQKINGRTIYKDTNNSTVDFEKDVTPQPGNYE